MSSTIAFLASFVSILFGAAIGMILKRSLPADMLEGGSKDAIRLGAGFLSTLAALVIGLMIASAKNTYDTQNTNIRQLGTNAVLVDQMLTKYGPEAKSGADAAAGNHSFGNRPHLAGKHRRDRRIDLCRHRDCRTFLQRGRRPETGQ